MQNFLSLGYMLRVLLAVSANFPDNPRISLLNDQEFPRNLLVFDWRDDGTTRVYLRVSTLQTAFSAVFGVNTFYL